MTSSFSSKEDQTDKVTFKDLNEYEQLQNFILHPKLPSLLHLILHHRCIILGINFHKINTGGALVKSSVIKMKAYFHIGKKQDALIDPLGGSSIEKNRKSVVVDIDGDKMDAYIEMAAELLENVRSSLTPVRKVINLIVR